MATPKMRLLDRMLCYFLTFVGVSARNSPPVKARHMRSVAIFAIFSLVINVGLFVVSLISINKILNIGGGQCLIWLFVIGKVTVLIGLIVGVRGGGGGCLAIL